MKQNLNTATIETVFLEDIDPADIRVLMNNRMVARYLPLLTGEFTHEQCSAFVAAKKQMWQEEGYGPWAFIIDNKFAGWGGLQPENGEADFALVLHPDYWGFGRRIFNLVKHKAFNELGIPSIMVLLPPERHNANAILRFGFEEVDSVDISGKVFRRFYCKKPDTISG